MAWKIQRTSKSVSVDVELDDFSNEELLQGLIDSKWVTETEAEAIRIRSSKCASSSIFKSTDAEELDSARDELLRGRRSEALIHLERFLGREWQGVLQ